MRLHRFFIEGNVGTQTELTIHSEELVNQIRRVFRLKTGNSVIVFDGSGFDYTCRIEDAASENGAKAKNNKNSITLAVMSSARSRFTPASPIYLCAGIVKRDTFEWIVEKATELGVTHIIPVLAEHSEKKSLNEKRLKKIATEASEQSGRGDIPEILPVMTVENSVNFLGTASDLYLDKSGKLEIMAFHTEAETFKRGKLSEKAPIAIFIGPEGGWSLDEIDMFHKHNIPIYSLGRQVLRAETAVIAALSQIVFGDL